ncbi:MAG: carboxypeptidase regulatory-like domain-containing protein [Rhodothermales bacterium]
MNRLVAVLLLAVCASVCAPGAWAQNATIRGFITDGADGEPLEGVNVILLNDQDRFLGASTNNDGFFAIPQVAPGDYVLQASYIGYITVRDTLVLGAGEILTNRYTLNADEANLDEVVVEAEREAAGAARVVAGQQTVRASDIELIPSPDVSGDIANYLTTLPGVVSTGDRGGQLFIRGGEPTQNLVLLDGIPIYQPFHIVGFYSAFPSDIINLADVYAGGFESKFGGRLSSVLDISTRNGNKRRLAGAASVAPFVSSLRLEGPIVRDHVSFMVSARESLIEQGASKLVDQTLPYNFGDRFAKLHANLGESSQISVTGLSTYDRADLGTNIEDKIVDIGDVPPQEVTWSNNAIGLRYLLLPVSLPMLAEILLNGTQLDSEVGTPGNPERRATTRQINAAVNATSFLRTLDINWGFFLNTYTLENELDDLFQNISLSRESVTEAGGYFQTDIRVGRDLNVVTGVRLQSFPSKSVSYLEPRVKAVWRYGAQRFSAAWGIYHQQIVGLTDRRDAGNIFTPWTASPLGSVPEAMHTLVGWQGTFGSLDLSVEGFHKNLKDLYISEWTALPRSSTRLQQADGVAQGIDLRMEVTRPGFHVLASYGLANVEYQAGQRTLPIWYGDGAGEFHPPHDRRHQVTLLLNLEIAGFRLNTQWQYGSGLPYNQAVGFDSYVLVSRPTINFFNREPFDRVIYDEPYGGRLPDYHRIDVSLERDVRLSPHAQATFQAGVINAYDRSNLFYLDLFTLGRVNQLPLVPSFGVKVEID